LQDPPKFTQIWIFRLKTNHLATLHTIMSIYASRTLSYDTVRIDPNFDARDAVRRRAKPYDLVVFRVKTPTKKKKHVRKKGRKIFS
jgi:hypothetical protein